VRAITSPPMTTYMLYKILKLEGIDLRGRTSYKQTVAEETLLTCKCCSKEKPAKYFSKKIDCLLGYDTSRCKDCKKSKIQWTKIKLEKKILNRTRTRAKQKGIDFNLEINDIIIPEKCPVYDHVFIYNDIDWACSIDRIDPNIGYVKGNIQIISNKANRLKNNATIEDIEKLLTWMKTL